MTFESARIPPHALDAEIALLGSVLLDNDALTRPGVSSVAPDAFYRGGHRQIWAAMLTLQAELPALEGAPGGIDLVTLNAELSRRGQLDAVGGLAYLIGLSEQTPTAAYAEHYARIVLEKAHLRTQIRHAGEVMRACYDQQLSLEEIDALASSAPRLEQEDRAVVRVGDVLGAVLDQAQNGHGPQGAPTGLNDLDALIGGLEPGRLYVEAARPGFGKTALAFQIAHHVAANAGRVLGFSLEMPAEEITARLACSEARVDLARFSDARRGTPSSLGPRDWQRLRAAQRDMDVLPLDILAKPGLKLQELVDEVRKAHRRDPLSLFVLDYIQLVQVSGRAGDNPVQRITQISNALKSLAMELQIPVLALSQLSRAVEQRPNHRPMLSDLRESGSLEQDADVVLFIYRDEMYQKDTDQQGIAELIVEKQRNGPRGTVKVQFLSAFVRFHNLAYSRYDAPESGASRPLY